MEFKTLKVHRKKGDVMIGYFISIWICIYVSTDILNINGHYYISIWTCIYVSTDILNINNIQHKVPQRLIETQS